MGCASAKHVSAVQNEEETQKGKSYQNGDVFGGPEVSPPSRGQEQSISAAHIELQGVWAEQDQGKWQGNEEQGGDGKGVRD
ncbi:hypothetical protein WISP_38099 [Willisornis vidua]|uniref:Uncharacterized protein n=1 Tax=Willisornis vidua TaxID=1566151 RepID=A0ABQ9DNK1_9PASS|nr:hypothetical protein WISP_38099 [Willisornis vidua]